MITLKALTPKRLKIVLVLAPLALALTYYSLIAADRYVSESTVALQKTGGEPPSLPGAAMLLAGLNLPAREETLYLRQYIQSLGLLKVLDQKLGLRKHFEAQKIDWPARLWDSASQESFLDYYRNRVEVSMDDLSGTLTVRAQGFDAAFAQRLNQAVLDESEHFVNEVSHQLAREKLRFAESELARASEHLQEAKIEVLAFQGKNKFLDPTVQAQASGMVTAEMQSQITKAETELRGLRTFLNDDSYQVKALRSQIDATRAQLDTERLRATGSGKESDRLGALTIDFQGLQMKAEFALDAYKLALAAVENARIDASRKLKSLVVIEPASLPETAEYPRRVYNMVTMLIGCLLLYGVVRLVIATIREHQD